ncbi:MAG TPA: response regulator [Candidatus Limnocylindrales bacterium]|jgi:two-component system KDP operon response regulator KdpE|nr:response regulator [Candidatus Limnocylindrales bacterium]
MPRPAVVLHVEDEMPNRALLRAVVGRSADPTVSGALILDAPDLAAARRILDEEPVDLVLLDVRLPDGNGLDLARDIAKAPAPRPDVIILSASVLPSERDAALASGASRFLEKPYVPSELISEIAASLVRRDADPVR